MISAAGRLKLYAQAESLLLQKDAVIIPLFYEPLPTLISRRSRGIELNPMNYLYLRGVSVD